MDRYHQLRVCQLVVAAVGSRCRVAEKVSEAATSVQPNKIELGKWQQSSIILKFIVILKGRETKQNKIRKQWKYMKTQAKTVFLSKQLTFKIHKILAVEK